MLPSESSADNVGQPTLESTKPCTLALFTAPDMPSVAGLIQRNDTPRTVEGFSASLAGQRNVVVLADSIAVHTTRSYELAAPTAWMPGDLATGHSR